MSDIIDDCQPAAYLPVSYQLLACALTNIRLDGKTLITSSDHDLRISACYHLSNFFSIVTKITISSQEISLLSQLMLNERPLIVSSSELIKNLYRAFLTSTYDNKVKIIITEEG